MLRREFLNNGTLTHRANPCQSQPAHAWEKLSRVAAGKPQLLLTALAKKPRPPFSRVAGGVSGRPLVILSEAKNLRTSRPFASLRVTEMDLPQQKLHVRRVVRTAGAGQSIERGGQLTIMSIVQGVNAANTEADGDATKQHALIEVVD